MRPLVIYIVRASLVESIRLIYSLIYNFPRLCGTRFRADALRTVSLGLDSAPLPMVFVVFVHKLRENEYGFVNHEIR